MKVINDCHNVTCWTQIIIKTTTVHHALVNTIASRECLIMNVKKSIQRSINKYPFHTIDSREKIRHQNMELIRDKDLIIII